MFRQCVPRILDTQEWCQELDSDPVADRETPLSSANIGQYYHKTGVLPRDIRRVPNQQSMDGKLQDTHNISNEKPKL